MKMLIICGHGAGDPGSVGNGYKEADLVREIAPKLKNILSKHMEVTLFDPSKNMYEYLKAGNKFNFREYKYVLELHFDACVKDFKGNGKTTGTGILVHTTEKGTSVEELILNKISELGFKNRGVKTMNLAMCNCSAMGTKASVLIEIGFMTNEYEASLLKTDAFCLECAEEAARGVCEYLGVTYKSSGTIVNTNTSVSNPTVSTVVSVPLKVNSTKKDIQTFLNTYYGDEIKKVLGALLVVDGAIGNKSKLALGIAIQVELNKLGAGLTIDGKIGTKSDSAWDKYIGVLKNGSKGIFVTLWQCILIAHNITLNGGIDGAFGNGSIIATNQLFAKIGLTKDSSVSGADINALL